MSEEAMLVCTDCEESFPEREARTGIDRDICCSCGENYYSCESCNVTYHEEDLQSYCGLPYCERCYDELVIECDECGTTVTRDDAALCGGEWCCLSCAGRNEEIFEYDHIPDFKFYGKEKKIRLSTGSLPHALIDCPLYFGIELEIEFNANSPDILIQAAENDYFYLKHDGSINTGAEVVSHPATYEWINKNFDETWGRVLNVKKEGMRSYNTETCGIHIHMSKTAFSKLHLYKFLRFFRENEDFIEKISQRKKHNLDQWALIGYRENIITQARRGSTGERYVAVNMGGLSTVEIRIFRGNLSEPGFRKNLEFCKALYDFTKVSSCSNLTGTHFKKFVSKKEFPNLSAFLLQWDVPKMKRVPTEKGYLRTFPSENKTDWSIDADNKEQEWYPEAPCPPELTVPVDCPEEDIHQQTLDCEVEESPPVREIACNEQPIDPERVEESPPVPSYRVAGPF